MNNMNYIDLGLPSGTKWKAENEEGFYTFDKAVEKYGDALPTKAQFEELQDHCKWEWNGSGYKIIGPNGNSIVLSAKGYRSCNGKVYDVGSYGYYWSSTPNGSDVAWFLFFYSSGAYTDYFDRDLGRSVRLVK